MGGGSERKMDHENATRFCKTNHWFIGNKNACWLGGYN